MNYFIRVKSREQLYTVIEWGKAKAILLDIPAEDLPDFLCGAPEADRSGAWNHEPELYICLPDVARQNKLDAIENIIKKAAGKAGLVIKNLDELGMVLEIGFEGKLIGDSFLYAYNQESFKLYSGLCPDIRFISSDELTDAELSKAVGNKRKKIIYKAYGHQTLMITNQCLLKSYDKCSMLGWDKSKIQGISNQSMSKDGDKGGSGDRAKHVIKFQNERGDLFYAQSNCSMCYSTIYNGRKTFMLDKLGEIEFDDIFLDFTFEDEGQMKEILNYIDEFECNVNDAGCSDCNMDADEQQKTKTAVCRERPGRPKLHLLNSGEITRGHHYQGVE